MEARAQVRKIPCSRKCGYERPYTDSLRWMSDVISHPLWGKVTNKEVVQKDMYWHDCKAYALAVARAQARFART